MTTVYVTHDQVEAMSMADKIVLIREGRIEQEGSPEELYARPATTFAARFIGTPAMNLVALDDAPGGAVVRGGSEVVSPGRGAGLMLGLRPEHLRLASTGGVHGTVTSAEYHGADTIVSVRVGQETLFVRAPGQLALAAGAQACLAWEPRDAHLFDARSGLRVDVDQALRDARIQQRKVG
jgi:sn-glycerol 3-phosphate transport system ATP-binding protein